MLLILEVVVSFHQSTRKSLSEQIVGLILCVTPIQIIFIFYSICFYFVLHFVLSIHDIPKCTSTCQSFVPKSLTNLYIVSVATLALKYHDR